MKAVTPISRNSADLRHFGKCLWMKRQRTEPSGAWRERANGPEMRRNTIAGSDGAGVDGINLPETSEPPKGKASSQCRKPDDRATMRAIG